MKFVTSLMIVMLLASQWCWHFDDAGIRMLLIPCCCWEGPMVRPKIEVQPALHTPALELQGSVVLARFVALAEHRCVRRLKCHGQIERPVIHGCARPLHGLMKGVMADIGPRRQEGKIVIHFGHLKTLLSGVRLFFYRVREIRTFMISLVPP